MATDELTNWKYKTGWELPSSPFLDEKNNQILKEMLAISKGIDAQLAGEAEKRMAYFRKVHNFLEKLEVQIDEEKLTLKRCWVQFPALKERMLDNAQQQESILAMVEEITQEREQKSDEEDIADKVIAQGYELLFKGNYYKLMRLRTEAEKITKKEQLTAARYQKLQNTYESSWQVYEQQVGKAQDAFSKGEKFIELATAEDQHSSVQVAQSQADSDFMQFLQQNSVADSQSLVLSESLSESEMLRPEDVALESGEIFKELFFASSAQETFETSSSESLDFVASMRAVLALENEDYQRRESASLSAWTSTSDSDEFDDEDAFDDDEPRKRRWWRRREE
ncbi:MAG: hypothetical protein LBI11_06900 [Streptococcaceae bacterium]|jgi:hypothetical protein|nr:hypothetical protein [Streptococcaceae bacterium]